MYRNQDDLLPMGLHNKRYKPRLKALEKSAQTTACNNKILDILTNLFIVSGQPHEGSSYAAQKDLQMAFHRFEHVKSRLNDLERLRTEHRLRQQQTYQRQMSGDHLANMQRAGYTLPNQGTTAIQQFSQQSTLMDFQSGPQG